MTSTRRAVRTLLVAVWLSAPALATPAQASDGVIEINQASALAGGIIPSDAPGFPVRLEAGSYLLTGDLETAGTALDVRSNNVRIDLNGFTVRCTGCGPGSHGVDANVRHHVHVSNGLIEDFGDAGIVIGAFGRVDHVGLRNNGGDGFDGALGGYSLITNSVAEGNGGTGFRMSSGDSLRDSMAHFNTEHGVHCSGDCSVSGSTMSFNTLNGILALSGGLIVDNIASNNTQHGIQTSGTGVIRGNKASQNGQIGIWSGATISGNTASSNTDDGIRASNGALVVGNNVSSNGGDGIEVQAAAKIDGNMIFFNTGAGLRFPLTLGDSTYQGNTLGGNAMPGIVGAATNAGNNYCNQGGGVC